MSRGVPALDTIPREPTMPSTAFNSSRGPPPGVGARQLVGNTLELSLLSRNSDQSASINSSHVSARIRRSSATTSSSSEGELEQSLVSGNLAQSVSTSVPSEFEFSRPMSSKFKEPFRMDSTIHRPSPAPISLPDVCPPSGLGPDGVVLSAPVLMLEAKLKAFEQQHRFMLGSLDREYHTRFVLRMATRERQCTTG